jgi:NAD(P)H-quinone oxidoreductase subunit 5
MENALGEPLPHADGPPAGPAPGRFRSWLYRLALERGYLDALLTTYVVTPFVSLFRLCDALERRWTDLLAGRASRESDRVQSSAMHVEDLP